MLVSRSLPNLVKRLGYTLLLGLVFVGPTAQALPIDFGDKVEAALLCRSDWATGYWINYFNTYLQKPLRDWGEARWWDTQGATLGGVATQEIFTNIGDGRVLMIGVLIPQPIENVRPQIEQNFHISFKPVKTETGERFVTDTLSVLVPTSNGQTKWYCAKWNMGNRP